MATPGIAIVGCGSAAPTTVLDNDTLGKLVETSDEWISTRTGIRRRHVAPPDLSLVDLAVQASTEAIAMAGIDPAQIDLVVLATSTADDLFGSAASIQHAIGAKQAVAFDLTAACSGFLFGLVTVSQFLQSGVYQNALLVGADILSRWVDWDDRRTCVLFGDGAGAIVVQAKPDAAGLLGFDMHSDGSQNSCLTLRYESAERPLIDGVSVNRGRYGFLDMVGKDVYKFAVTRVPETIEKSLFRADLTVEDIDWLLLHQANQRIVDAVAKRLKIPMDRTLGNLSEYGNTSAASIPLALDAAVRSGRVKPGDTIAASGFGAGLSWGSAIFRWGV
ncbi:MAG: ketoacyl-ACP synthase III [Oscillatoriales cyanobacterium]|jgi:3-oxoacyl-[acyl-carrier-protein] synthase III|nr:MAG: ketoacyl-ACP synthase III [Oscillatoriales cyanobacterium]